jgi:hypothetical protein
MKKLIVLAALLGGIAITQQASACDWMHEAGKAATVATCDNGTCPTDQQSQEATATAAAAPQSAEQPAPAPASPTIVASGQ